MNLRAIFGSPRAVALDLFAKDRGGGVVTRAGVERQGEIHAKLRVLRIELGGELEQRHGCGRVLALGRVNRGGLAQVAELFARVRGPSRFFTEQLGKCGEIARLAVELAETLSERARVERQR